jgi:addiction module RelB/DinJ family antitoxin
MASNTSAVYARVDTNLKKEAENILARLGISASTAIQMLYSQVVLRRGLPFDLHLPPEKPLSAGSLTEEQLNGEILKGIKSAEEGTLISDKEIDEELKKRFGI